MQHVDCLSRNPPISNKNISVAVIKTEDWLLIAQNQDKKIKNLQIILKTSKTDKHRHVFSDYVCRDDRVYRNSPHGLRWVVPKRIRFQICHMNHDELGHFAFNKTYKIIPSKYWFPKMRKFIKKYVNNCLNCLYFKTAGGRKLGFLHPILIFPISFHTIHVDQTNTHFLSLSTHSRNLYYYMQSGEQKPSMQLKASKIVLRISEYREA